MIDADNRWNICSAWPGNSPIFIPQAVTSRLNALVVHIKLKTDWNSVRPKHRRVRLREPFANCRLIRVFCEPFSLLRLELLDRNLGTMLIGIGLCA
jgi:hypothetical protein